MKLEPCVGGLSTVKTVKTVKPPMTRIRQGNRVRTLLLLIAQHVAARGITTDTNLELQPLGALQPKPLPRGRLAPPEHVPLLLDTH